MTERSNYDGLSYADAVNLAKHKHEEIGSIINWGRGEQEDVIVKSLMTDLPDFVRGDHQKAAEMIGRSHWCGNLTCRLRVSANRLTRLGIDFRRFAPLGRS